MPNITILNIILHASSFLGFASLVTYFYFLLAIKGAERSVRGLIEGNDPLTEKKIVKILSQFKDDESRLNALKTLTSYEGSKAKDLLAKFSDKTDITHLSTVLSRDYRKSSMIAAIFFSIVAFFAFLMKDATPQPSTQIDYKREVDFRQLQCKPDGKKNDVVVFSDTVSFVSGLVPDIYGRSFNVSNGAGVSVHDLVSGERFEPKQIVGGNEKYGEVNFKVDKSKKEARFEWSYTNAHSTANEGVGFTASDPYVVRTVDVNYYFPNNVRLTNMSFIPEKLGSKCTEKAGGFHCENLLTSEKFSKVWHWNVWDSCP